MSMSNVINVVIFGKSSISVNSLDIVIKKERMDVENGEPINSSTRAGESEREKIHLKVLNQQRE